MSEIIKACVYCEHCDYSEATDYGGRTGFEPASWSCVKYHFESKDSFIDMVDGDLYLKAQQCDDFELKSEIQAKLDDTESVKTLQSYLVQDSRVESARVKVFTTPKGQKQRSSIEVSVMFKNGKEWLGKIEMNGNYRENMKPLTDGVKAHFDRYIKEL